MPRSLQEEIHQTKPFSSIEEEAALNIVRTATALSDATEGLLKGFDLTATQYNVLRILRGAEPTGLCRNELRDRMVTRMPDVTRLLDRMEDAGLVARTREQEDRRMVLTRISASGRTLVDSLDVPMKALHHRTLGHLSPPRLAELVTLLTQARAGSDPSS
jgi:DNA-binding MarR family transcriptional regulator